MLKSLKNIRRESGKFIMRSLKIKEIVEATSW